MEEKEIEAIGFDHKGKKYVIKVLQVRNRYTVKSYLNGMEVSSYSYPDGVDSINIANWENYYGSTPPFVRLIELAKEDIKKGYGLKKEIVS